MLSFIGKIITQLREEQSLTIAELSERSSVSVEKLTEIETGAVTPSVGVMIKISRALGSRLGTLLDGHESAGAVVTRAKDSASAPSEVIAGGDVESHRNMSFYSLAQGKKDRSMEPMFVEVEAGEDKVSLLSEHEGEEFLYVLDGSIEVKYGNQVHSLSKGDSIYYDSIVAHQITSASPSSAHILAVIYTPY